MKFSKLNSLIFISIILLCFLYQSKSYEKINNREQIMAIYERYSYYPILHVFYNRHFSNSKQFNNFVQVIQDVQYQIGQYAKIIFTDCQQDKGLQNYACKQIKRLNDNRMIIGETPSNQFTNFGDKIMQSPPKNRVFDHHSDSYTSEQIVNFINQMVPNFYKQISNTYEFQEFKNPKYSPKLVYGTRQGQVPQVLKRLGVTFFQKFDMAYVQDLTQSIINQLQISKFPSLLVLKHNFETQKLQVFPYQSYDFSQNQYFKIKKFLQKYALKQKRSDYVFHLIKPIKQNSIYTVDNQPDLKQLYDRLKGWIFLSQGPTNQQLVKLKDKYGFYYNYIHFLKPQLPENLVFLYNARSNIKYQYDDSQVQYRLMNAQDFQSNSTLWLKKDYVVLGARQAFGHLCALVDQTLFAGLTQCFIIDQNYYKEVTKLLGVQFQYGFIVTTEKSSSKVKGNQIKDPNYQVVYNLLQFATRSKVKEIIDDFMQNPVKDIQQTTSIQQLCAQPFKKCIFYFEQNIKDQTNRQYLQLEAMGFSNEYKMFAVNLSCNKHIYQQISQMQNKPNGLIAYHPRQNKFVYLKAKINRNVIKKFLKINNQQKKSLPFKQFTDGKFIINGCQNKKQQKTKQNNSQEEDFVTQL